MNGGLPCGGKGQPGRQPGGQLRREGGAFQGGGNPLLGGQVAALAAEYKGIHAAQGGKASHGACGKVFGGGNSIGQRQLQDEVNAAVQGGCDPVLPRAKGGLTALHKVAADDGDGMGGAPVAGGLEGQQVPPVQGVPFGNNGSDRHGQAPFGGGDIGPQGSPPAAGSAASGRRFRLRRNALRAVPPAFSQVRQGAEAAQGRVDIRKAGRLLRVGGEGRPQARRCEASPWRAKPARGRRRRPRPAAAQPTLRPLRGFSGGKSAFSPVIAI